MYTSMPAKNEESDEEEEMDLSEDSETVDTEEDDDDEGEEYEDEEEQLEPKVLPNRSSRALRLNKVIRTFAAIIVAVRFQLESTSADAICLPCSSWKRRSLRMRSSGTRSSLPRKPKMQSSKLLNLNKRMSPTATSANR